MRMPRSLAPILSSALFILLLALAGVALDRHVYNAIGFPNINGISLVRAAPVSGGASDGAVHASEAYHPDASGSDLPGSVEFLETASGKGNVRFLRDGPQQDSPGNTVTLYIDTVTSAKTTNVWLLAEKPDHTETVTQKYYYAHKTGGTKTLALTSTISHVHKHYAYTVVSSLASTPFTVSSIKVEHSIGNTFVTHTAGSTSTVTVFASGSPPPGVTADGTSVVFADYTITVPHVRSTLAILTPTCIRSTVPGSIVYGAATETETITSSVFKDVTVTSVAAASPSRI